MFDGDSGFAMFAGLALLGLAVMTPAMMAASCDNPELRARANLINECLKRLDDGKAPEICKNLKLKE